MRQIKKGSTDRSVYIRFIDSTTGEPETGVVYNSAGISLWYCREGGTVQTLSLSALAAVDSAHADGGFIHRANGECRLDLPDAAWATGSGHVQVGGTATGMIVITTDVQLTNYDPETVPLDEVTAARMGALTDWINGGRLDLLMDALLARLTETRAGYLDLLSTYLDAAVSTRLSADGYTAPLNAAGTRTALGLASENLDTQLAAIKTKTDNLSDDPAATGAAMTLTSGERTALIAAFLATAVEDTETFVQALRIIRAGVAASSTGATVPASGDPITMLSRDGSKARITGVVDAAGNRTVSATDGS